MTKRELTGKTRYREVARPFAPTLLVLQVEERKWRKLECPVLDYEFMSYDWRDARAEDLGKLSEIERVRQ